MIVYSELSSLCRDLGFTARELYAASRNTDRLYRKAVLPEAGRGGRELSVPSPLLKAIQTAVYEKLLSQEPVSRYACAYRPGGGIKRCAAPHVGRGQVLTLDIRRFFDSAIYPLIKEKVFTPERYSEPNRVLLSMLCTYRDALPQGAPSSPAISNILLYGFDEAVGAYCRERDIRYTRYCDDMAFSGLFDARELTAFVESELKKLGFFLNRKKTRLASQGQRQAVTGVIVNEKLAVPREYKRRLRQELYYIEKYGMEEHLSRLGGEAQSGYAARLLGRVNYVLSIEPGNKEAAHWARLLQGIK